MRVGAQLTGLRRYALPLALVLSTAWAGAHVRLIFSDNGNVLYWQSPSSISVVINSAGSDDLPDRTQYPALRNAIDEWNAVTGTQAHLVEDTSAASQASTNWSSSQHHMMLFDESNSSGFFPSGSGIVAVTPLTFYSSGKIIDADVLFNGSDFNFTTSREANAFDVQDVATHELGHLLGLDHSGCAGASMYPYVDPSVILHRSLSSDEIAGLQSMYPVSPRGSIRGTVQRSSSGTPVRGAWVAARDSQGRLVAGALAKSDGSFKLHSITPGNYSVYATPLDYPVSATNLGAGRTIDTDFASTVSGPVTVSGTSETNMGSLFVGPDVDLSLGRVSDDYPLRATTGKATSLTIRGAGLKVGSILTASDPALELTNIQWLKGQVRFTVAVPEGASPGHVDMTVSRPGGQVSILSAALEVTPDDPRLTLVSPPSGPATGGTVVTILGSGFRAGARVVVGDQVYQDGKPGGCMVNSDASITLTTRNSIPGVHDVTVIDSSGVEGRALASFSAQANPVLDSVFPPVGNSAGGTQLTLSGSSLVAGSTVHINGVLQPNLYFMGLNQIQVITQPGTPGGPYTLTVTSPGGGADTGSYSYVNKPDPRLLSVNPDTVGHSGGDAVTLRGYQLDSNTEVWVGCDPLTGVGGKRASTSLVDTQTLTISAPAFSGGSRAVLVRDPVTGQASMVPGALTYTAPPQKSVGGGCGMVSPGGPTSWARVLAGSGWILALMGWLLVRRQRFRLSGA